MLPSLHGLISTMVRGLDIHRENNDVSLQRDRVLSAVKRIEVGRGLLVPQLVTVGNIPLKFSKLCHCFMCHVGNSMELLRIADTAVPLYLPVDRKLSLN